MSTEAKFEQWAIVDVMGHQRFVGLVTEQVIAGTGFIRVDIPETSRRPAWTKIIGPGSIYGMTPVSEAIARRLAENTAPPISAFDIKALTAPKLASPVDDDEDPDDWAA